MIKIKRTLAAVAVAGVGGVTAFTMTAGPALALPADYTVTSGGSTNDVTANNLGPLEFQDTYYGWNTGAAMVCDTLDADGEVFPGDHAFTTGSTVTDAAGQVTPAAGDLDDCTNTVVGDVELTPSGTWKLGLSSKSGNGGTGYLSGVQVHLHGDVVDPVTGNTETCDADAAGTLKGTYDGTTGQLTLDHTYNGLTLTNVTSSNPTAPVPLCDNVGIYEGDPAAGDGVVQLTPAPSIS